MCGIFGFQVGEGSRLDASVARRLLRDLYLLSESRGKEASGAAMLSGGTIRVAKHAVAASDLIRQPEYRRALDATLRSTNGTGRGLGSCCVIGHSRLVTNGAQQIQDNNQPVVSSDIVGIHNGIVTNVDDLWRRHPELDRRFTIDTEVLLALLRSRLADQDLVGALRGVYADLEGSASIALLFRDRSELLLATDNGSLYSCRDDASGLHVFASERFILETIAGRRYSRHHLRLGPIRQVPAGTGIILDLSSLDAVEFSLNGADERPTLTTSPHDGGLREVEDVSPRRAEASGGPIPGEGPYILSPSFVDEHPGLREAVARLPRCTRCILPATMPFIDFDEDGVCSYCRHYRPLTFRGIDALRADVEPHLRQGEGPDCLVTFSGGRDSSYGVHFVKRVLGWNPVTYTYDWGMVTDLARRNQMRICGKLGIEHILVSADIARKRGNIRRNVSAWLRRPDLGTVPLFMAGDKQYFYYANKVARQTGCRVIVLCENLLETTRFKSGFCGVRPRHSSEHTYSLTLGDKARMALYYGFQYLRNPAYLNRSILDTLGAFASYYIIPHDYLNLYGYVRWDEEEINRTLIGEYNWETAVDTDSTWRIGDGTAPFYNFIYYTMAGFSENDTFRSNQVREGDITREEALRLAEEENAPRYESMQWYCDVVGIDFEEAVRAIRGAPRLYTPEGEVIRPGGDR